MKFKVLTALNYVHIVIFWVVISCILLCGYRRFRGEYILLLLLLLLLLYDMDVSCHRPFLLGTSLEPAVIPLLRLQASHCSTFRIICDVPSIAVFCNESIECFPGTVSRFFLQLHVTIPVVLIIAGIIVHFRFHIRCISIHKLLYFNFFSASFAQHFCLWVLLLLLLLLLLLKKCLTLM